MDSGLYQAILELRRQRLNGAIAVVFVLFVGRFVGAFHAGVPYGISPRVFQRIFNAATVVMLILSALIGHCPAWTDRMPNAVSSGSPSSIKESLLLATGAWLAGVAAIVMMLPHLILPLHEDVAYITQATYRLIQDGNLKNAGMLVAFQALRPNFHETVPFFAHYLVPVFYYWPFFKLFGATDPTFFLGQAVLLVFLGVLIARSGLGWRWTLLVLAASLLSQTIFDTVVNSPTQLVALCIVAFFWQGIMGKRRALPLLDGLLLGIGTALRPEVILTGVLMLGQAFMGIQKTRERWRFAGRAAAGLALSLSFLAFLRHILGAANDHDSKLILLLSDVIAKNFDVLSVSHVPRLSDLFRDPVLSSLFRQKILHRMGEILLPWPHWGRRDELLAVVPLFLAAAGVVRLKDYRWIYLLLALQTLSNIALLPMPRHSDWIFFLLLWNLALDMKRWMEVQVPALRKVIEIGLLLVIIAVLARPLARIKEDVLDAWELRQTVLQASNVAHGIVPQNAFVITDRPELWIWYGRGTMCCFLPINNAETLRLLLIKFPHAYIIAFTGDGRAGYPLAVFARPLLSTEADVTIYGPQAAT